jgi:hypothetical protein
MTCLLCGRKVWITQLWLVVHKRACNLTLDVWGFPNLWGKVKLLRYSWYDCVGLYFLRPPSYNFWAYKSMTETQYKVHTIGSNSNSIFLLIICLKKYTMGFWTGNKKNVKNLFISAKIFSGEEPEGFSTFNHRKNLKSYIYLFTTNYIYRRLLLSLVFSQTHVSLSGQHETVDVNEANEYLNWVLRSPRLWGCRLWSGILDRVVL